MVDVFAQEAANGVAVSFACSRFLFEDHRHALVGGGEHTLAFGDDAEEWDRQDLLHIVHFQHLTPFNAGGVVASDEQVLLHRRAALFRAL